MFTDRVFIGQVLSASHSTMEKYVLLKSPFHKPGVSWFISSETSKQLEIAPNTLKKVLKDLTQKAVIRKIKRGEYAYNPPDVKKAYGVHYGLVGAALSADLATTHRVVLASIVAHLHEGQNKCWPSDERILKQASISRTGYYRALKYLKEHDFVTRINNTQGVSFLVNSGKLKASITVKNSTGNDQKWNDESPNLVNTPIYNKVFNKVLTGQQVAKEIKPDLKVPGKKPMLTFIKKQKEIKPELPKPQSSGKSVESILSAMKSKPVKVKAGYQSLVQAWKRGYSEVVELNSLTPVLLKNKELGQLKMIYNGLGDNALELFKKTLYNWTEFKDYVKDSAGLKQAPSLPSIGFILVHVHLIKSFIPDAYLPEDVVNVMTPANIKPKYTKEEAMKMLQED